MSGLEIIGDRIKIQPMKLEHVFKMRNWGFHTNPLLFDYNLPELTDGELKQWYIYKTRSFSRKYYSVFNELGILIGYFGIKNIRRILREATLGIALDPNYVNMGYGSEILTIYLEYFFHNMKMRTMYLEVAKFNKRAINCYRKVGFRIVDKYLGEFFNQNLNLDNPYYLKVEDAFVIQGGKIYNYIYKMKIDKMSYLKKGD